METKIEKTRGEVEDFINSHNCNTFTAEQVWDFLLGNTEDEDLFKVPDIISIAYFKSDKVYAIYYHETDKCLYIDNQYDLKYISITTLDYIDKFNLKLSSWDKIEKGKVCFIIDKGELNNPLYKENFIKDKGKLYNYWIKATDDIMIAPANYYRITSRLKEETNPSSFDVYELIPM